MKNGKTEPIGECGCPRPGCTHQVKLYRYQERSARPSMFKGKFYGSCPDHGRVIDAGDKVSQEYVLNTEGAIWGATDNPKSSPTEPDSTTAGQRSGGSISPAARSTPIPASKPAAPAQQPTPKPATSTAVVPSPTPEPAPRPARGWNLTDWWTELFG